MTQAGKIKGLCETPPQHSESVARVAYQVWEFMQESPLPVEVTVAAIELNLVRSTVHRVLKLMLNARLASFEPAPAAPEKGPGRGRLYVWKSTGTAEEMEKVFGVKPKPCAAEARAEPTVQAAFPSIFHVGSEAFVRLPAWPFPVTTASSS